MVKDETIWGTEQIRSEVEQIKRDQFERLRNIAHETMKAIMRQLKGRTTGMGQPNTDSVPDFIGATSIRLTSLEYLALGGVSRKRFDELAQQITTGIPVNVRIAGGLKMEVPGTMQGIGVKDPASKLYLRTIETYNIRKDAYTVRFMMKLFYEPPKPPETEPSEPPDA